MRPVQKGTSPVATPPGFANYEDAKPDLISRLGPYCSYCERKIVTILHVEHLQPKGLPKYAHLELAWTNFLLACVNCNSTKLTKDVLFADLYFPDRDNTFAAFIYTPDGKVAGNISANPTISAATLALTGFANKRSVAIDTNGKEVAIDRGAQRMEQWIIAEAARDDFARNPSPELLRSIVRTALACGHFSIWMTVFAGDGAVRNALVDAFPGTRASGCFDAQGNPISPAPNPDRLADGGKV
jgi:uncharacterized protein (TIGR02646 family)